MQHALSQELLAFLDASPTCFHAVKNLADWTKPDSHRSQKPRSGS